MPEIILKPLEFQVVAKVVEVDDTGDPVGVHTILQPDGQPLVFIGVKPLREFVDGFDELLLKTATQQTLERNKDAA